MITRSDAGLRARRDRAARIGIAASLALHALAFAVAFDASDFVAKFQPHRRPPPADESVAMSTVLHIERRARPAPAKAAQAAHAPGAPRVAVAAPHPQRLPAPLPAHLVTLPKAAYPPPAAARKLLAKRRPRATPQALRLASPRVEAIVASRVIGTEAPRRVAFAPRAAPPAQAERLARPQTYNAAQLAAIQADLARSLVRYRANKRTVSSASHVNRPAATVKRYDIDTEGLHATLHGARGVCVPIKTWLAGGLVNFYVTCTTQRADGSVRNEAIPWPLRYRPSQISYGADGSPQPPAGHAIVLPPRGWRLDRSQYVDPDVIDYLKEHGYPV